MKAPIDCKTERDICRLARTVCETKRYWINFDEHTVTLTEQLSGEPATQKISLPKSLFDKFVRFYTTEQQEQTQ